MRYSVEDYRLPEGAGALDRASLAAWKAWEGWVRPAIAVAALAILGYVVVGWLVGLPSPDASLSPYRYLVRWASLPRPPLASPSFDGTSTYGPSVLWWAIAAQAAAAGAGAAAGFWLLRRARRPVAVGALAGLVVGVLHVAVAGLWTLTPLGGGAGSYAITPRGSFTAPPIPVSEVHLYVGSALQNGLAIAALWSPVAFGALAGWAARRRRRRRRSPGTGA
jgi:hypothetical protein